jgi:serine/threonine protein kinase
MTPERWREVERIYEGALACEPSGRAAYIAKACSGDEALRHEVESLLAHSASAEHFIEEPAIAGAGALAGLSPDTAKQVSLTPGTRLGAYEILALIGRGGMGAVYRARDMRLDRSVAIKVVSASADIEAQ